MKLFKSTVVAVALVAGLSTFSVGVSASENQQVKSKRVSLQTAFNTRIKNELWVEPSYEGNKNK